MTLEDARQALLTAGYRAAIVVKKPSGQQLVISPNDFDEASGIRVLPPPYLWIRETPPGWTFERVLGTGGFLPHDFWLKCSSLSEAVSAAGRWLNGEPSTIEGWVVPVHQHPEWSIERLEGALAVSQRSSAARWERRRRAGEEQVFAAMRLNSGASEAAMHALFVPVEHCDRNDITLWLRRDLEEACVAPRSPEDEGLFWKAPWPSS